MPRPVIQFPPKKGQTKAKRQPADAPEKKAGDQKVIWDTIAFGYAYNPHVWRVTDVCSALIGLCTCTLGICNPTEEDEDCLCLYNINKFAEEQTPKELLFFPADTPNAYIACTYDNKQIEVVREVKAVDRGGGLYSFHVLDTQLTIRDVAKKYPTHVSAMVNSFFEYDKDKVVEYAMRTFGGM
jgi:hypothetical protein